MYLFFSIETEVMFSQLHTQNHSSFHTVKWPWLVPQRPSALTDGTITIFFSTQHHLTLTF